MNTQAAMVDYEEESLSIGDYIKVLRRRKKVAAIAFGSILFAAILLALLWPATYRSESIILIEEQEVPSNLVQTTITSYAQQRIEQIKQRIMTIGNIMDVVEQFELYSEKELETKTRTEIANEFRKAVTISPISADVVDPQSGKPRAAVIAFSLAFDGDVPGKVQKIANEITTLYLNENLRERTAQTQSTSAFLASESEILSGKLSELDRQIAEFKEINKGALPELQNFNLSVVDRTESQLNDLNYQIKEQQKRKIKLTSDLAKLSPTAPVVLPSGERVLGDADRLKALESEYRQKAAVYRADHPDVVRLKREIDSLFAEVGQTEEHADKVKQLAEERDRLTGLETRYTDDHPEVRNSRRVVAVLEEELSQAIKKETEVDPDNPAYILVQNQLLSVEEDLRVGTAKISELEAKLEKYESYLSKAPQVEKEYQSLLREKVNTQSKYNEIRTKQMSAELAQSLESERKGERFTLIQPPELPREPISPNRPVIVLLGIILAAGASLASVLIYEALDGGVYGVSPVVQFTGAPPLVSVGFMETPSEASNHQQKRFYMLLGAVVFAILFVIFFHFFIKPLDVTWFILMRRLGLS